MTDDAAPFIIEGLGELRGYTQQPAVTYAELCSLLDSLKQRLVVPAERVGEFEDAVRAAGLDGSVTVVGHPFLKPDQAVFMQSEAEFEADQQEALERGRDEMLAELKAETQAQMEALRERLRAKAYMRASLPSPPLLRGPLGGGGVAP